MQSIVEGANRASKLSKQIKQAKQTYPTHMERHMVIGVHLKRGAEEVQPLEKKAKLRVNRSIRRTGGPTEQANRTSKQSKPS